MESDEDFETITNIINTSEVLKLLKNDFENCVLDEERTSSSEIHLRVDLKSRDDAENFVLSFSSASKTEWNVSKDIKNVQRLVFSKSWTCHHSKRNKTENSSKNAMCPAKLRIIIKKINKSTCKNDPFLRLPIPLAGKIVVSTQHSHNLMCADALRQLRVNDEVKNNFYDYFSSGLGVQEAIRRHENKFLVKGNFEDLADSSVNPTRRQVYYLHALWRETNLGSHVNPLNKLREKIPLYETEGTLVKIFEKPEAWAVLVVTAVMRRTQPLDISSEMIYIDSTSSCESSSSTLTVLLAATKIGALPIAVLIHQAQTMENYEDAFNLLKQHFPNCFGGKKNPVLFMTDDSKAEKGALKKVWPESKQLLCHFHVAQAEWRWIFSNCNCAEERPALMKLFQEVMYSKTDGQLTKAVENLLAKGQSVPGFVKRFEKFFNRKSEWVLLYRQDFITRKNNTNNYAEATIRILKDIVLCRTKAFNVVALTEFCMGVWESYLVSKLLDFAHSRRPEVFRLYEAIRSRTAVFNPVDMVKVADNTYTLASGSRTYTIDTAVGACTCPSGTSGAFCKHQCFIMESEKIPLPNAPPTNAQDRYDLAKLALGSKCPAPYFFSGYLLSSTASNCLNDPSSETKCHEEMEGEKMEVSEVPVSSTDDGCNEIDQLKTSSHEEIEVEMLTEVSSTDDGCNEIDQLKTSSHEEIEVEMLTEVSTTDDVSIEIENELERVKYLAKQKSGPSALRFLNTLKKLKNSSDLDCLFYLRQKKRTRRINVQPTSISRRRSGLVRSKKRVPSGRPPKVIINPSKKKRAHSLQESITRNIPSAKKGH